MKKTILVLSIPLLFCLKLFSQTSDSLPRGFINEKINIAGIANGDISNEKMLSAKGLSFGYPASLKYHITSFRMTLIVGGETPREFTNEKSGELTTEMRNAIKGAVKGSKVYFEYIKCTDKDNLVHSLYAVNYILQ